MWWQKQLDRTEIAIVVMIVAAWWALVALLAGFTSASGERPLWLQAMLWAFVAASLAKAVLESRREYRRKTWRDLKRAFDDIDGEMQVVRREEHGGQVRFQCVPDEERGGGMPTLQRFLLVAERAGRALPRRWRSRDRVVDDAVERWVDALPTLALVETEFDLEDGRQVSRGVVEASRVACDRLADVDRIGPRP